jgi:hypothetical protein
MLTLYTSLFANLSVVFMKSPFLQLRSVDALRKIVCSEVVQMTAKDRETGIVIALYWMH